MSDKKGGTSGGLSSSSGSSGSSSSSSSGSSNVMEVARDRGVSETPSYADISGGGSRALLAPVLLKEGYSANDEKEKHAIAAQRLLLNLEELEGRVTEGSLPYEVEKGVNVRAYNELLELEHPFMLDWRDGVLSIVEMVSGEHDGASRYCGTHFSNIFGQHLNGSGSQRWGSSRNDKGDMEGDESWAKPPAADQPLNAAEVLAFFVEIGWSQIGGNFDGSTPKSLREKACRWINETPCNEVLLVSMENWPKPCWGEVWRRDRTTGQPICKQHEDLYRHGHPPQYMLICMRSVFSVGLAAIPQDVLDNAYYHPETGSALIDLCRIVGEARKAQGQRDLMARDPHYVPPPPPAPVPTRAAATLPAGAAATAPPNTPPRSSWTEYNDLHGKVHSLAVPLADWYLSNRIYSLLFDVASRQDGRLLVGYSDVKAKLRAGDNPRALVIIAGNRSEEKMMKMMKIVEMCKQNKNVSWVFTPAHELLSRAIAMQRANVIMLLEEPEYGEIFDAIDPCQPRLHLDYSPIPIYPI